MSGSVSEADSIEAAVQALLDARFHRRQAPAPAVPSRRAAYLIQAEIARRSGGFGAWKVAAFGPGREPVFAPVLPDTVTETGVRFAPSRFHMIGIEGEVAIRLGPALPSSADRPRRDALPGLATEIRAAIEIVDTRLSDSKTASEPARIADNMSSGALVLGAPIAVGIDLAAPGFEVVVNGQLAAPAGKNGLGGPFDMLGACLEHCAQQGIDLPAGAWVTTGSSTGIVFASEGDAVMLVRQGETLVQLNL